jgi:hypothetical protein
VFAVCEGVREKLHFLFWRLLKGVTKEIEKFSRTLMKQIDQSLLDVYCLCSSQNGGESTAINHERATRIRRGKTFHSYRRSPLAGRAKEMGGKASSDRLCDIAFAI